MTNNEVRTTILYGYDPKLILTWLNKKTIEYQVKVFEKKCAYVPTDYPITESVPT